jgi:hypothetical protein
MPSKKERASLSPQAPPRSLAAEQGFQTRLCISRCGTMFGHQASGRAARCSFPCLLHFARIFTQAGRFMPCPGIHHGMQAGRFMPCPGIHHGMQAGRFMPCPGIDASRALHALNRISFEPRFRSQLPLEMSVYISKVALCTLCVCVYHCPYCKLPRW